MKYSVLLNVMFLQDYIILDKMNNKEKKHINYNYYYNIIIV